jgi:hypothetical protein
MMSSISDEIGGFDREERWELAQDGPLTAEGHPYLHRLQQVIQTIFGLASMTPVHMRIATPALLVASPTTTLGTYEAQYGVSSSWNISGGLGTRYDGACVVVEVYSLEGTLAVASWEEAGLVMVPILGGAPTASYSFDDASGKPQLTFKLTSLQLTSILKLRQPPSPEAITPPPVAEEGYEVAPLTRHAAPPPPELEFEEDMLEDGPGGLDPASGE